MTKSRQKAVVDFMAGFKVQARACSFRDCSSVISS